jgi:hypothetical protein
LPATAIGAALRPKHPGDNIGKLALAVAGNAGDPDDFTGAQCQRYLLKPDPAVLAGRHPVEHKERRAKRHGRLVRRPELTAAHQASKLRLGQRAVILPLGYHGAVTHHGDPIGDGKHLAELVGNEDHRHAAAGHGAQGPEQALGFLGRQRRCRLVQHQDTGAARQRFGDFHALLLADRKLADQAIGVEVKVEVAADCGEPLDHHLARQTPVRPGAADHEVFQHGVPRHQFEVLVHHADAELERVSGTAHRDGAAVYLDRAGIGGISAEQHVHQAGLAGPILAEESEDVAGVEREIHPGAGLYRPEPFGDAAHGDQGWGHGTPTSPWKGRLWNEPGRGKRTGA